MIEIEATLPLIFRQQRSENWSPTLIPISSARSRMIMTWMGGLPGLISALDGCSGAVDDRDLLIHAAEEAKCDIFRNGLLAPAAGGNSMRSGSVRTWRASPCSGRSSAYARSGSRRLA
ncbi:MAG: hypothetical protein U0Z44_11965 [Kouleothrix sp.]